MRIGTKQTLVGQYWELKEGIPFLHQTYELHGPWDGITNCYRIKFQNENGRQDEDILHADSMELAIEKLRAYYEGRNLTIIQAVLTSENKVPTSPNVS